MHATIVYLSLILTDSEYREFRTVTIMSLTEQDR